MDCRRTRELLDALSDGELQFDLAKAVLGHLKSCPPCRSEADELRSLGLAVRRVGAIEVPGGLAGRIVSEARFVRVAPIKPSLRSAWPRVAALLAGAAAVIWIATPLAMRERPVFDEAAPLRLLVSDAHIDLDLVGSFANDLAGLSRLPEGRLMAELADIKQ